MLGFAHFILMTVENAKIAKMDNDYDIVVTGKQQVR